MWQRPPPQVTPSKPPAGLMEPGWTPKVGGPVASGWKPVKSPATGHHQPVAQHSMPAPAPVHRPVPVQAPPPAAQHQYPVNRPRPAQRGPAKPYVQHIQPEYPAWAGSLKSSGGPKPWEMREAEVISGGGPSGIPPAPQAPVNVHQPRVQTVTYGPGSSAPTYGQQNPATYGDSDTAQVRHLQYNSPLGLYSKDNVQDALTGQTAGRPGEGTMQ